ncbi:MAG TPA: ATP-binding protein [Bacteroidales bacterium]|nr:ATP-binding protein [Bacteroidales bacterium]
MSNEKKSEKFDYNIYKLLEKGKALLEKDPNESLVIAETIIKEFKDDTASIEYIQAIYLKASANSFLENYRKALSDFFYCLRSRHFVDDTTLLADLKFDIARCYDCLSDISRALSYYQSALNLYQRNKDIYGQAKVLQNIGIIESDRENDSVAMNYYGKALELYILLNNKVKQAAILQNIGVVYSNQEKYPQTIEYYKKALRIFLNLKNYEGIASVENNLGLTSERILKYNEALSHYKNALIYFEKINSRTGLAYVYDNIASLCRRQRMTDEAIYNYKLSIQYADSVEILDFAAFVNKELAGLYEEIGDYRESLRYYKIANELEDSVSNDQTRRKLNEAEAYFHGELKDVEIQKQQFQLQVQKREKAIYLSGIGLLLILMAGLIWAYRKKTIAENKLRKHQEFLEEEVQQRTNELKVEVFGRQAAEEADKLKTAFLANMSHEIRTPMNAILAFSNFLKDTDISGAQRNEYIRYINSCSKSLLRLVDDILDTAKIEAKQLRINPAPCFINSILNELYVYFQNHRKCQEGDIVLHVSTACLARNFSIVTDNTRVRQIFTNLLDNAFKFTEKGEISFGFLHKDDMFEFFVKDTGTGIPHDKIDLVFKRFGQVNDNSNKLYKGTGLGLSISKNLVELLGGKMWLETTEGKGSCFYFTLPAADLTITKLLEPSDAIVIPEKKRDWKNFTLIVAEDDDLNFKLIQIALNKTGIHIIRAENGEEVLQIASANKDIDAVLMDIQMPILDGYETTRRLKANYPHICVIAQTAFAMSDDREKCLKAGCDDYISKPIDIDDLYKKLNITLRKETLRKRIQ